MRLTWRSRDKIPRLNLRHSRRLPKLRTPRSKRSWRSCAAAPQRTRSLSQCALCAANGGTMQLIVGTNSTRTRQSLTWPWQIGTRRRWTWPNASRLAKRQRLAPPLLLLKKRWRPLRPPRTPTTHRVMSPPYTVACLIKRSCRIRLALSLIAVRKSTSLKEPWDPAPAFNSPVLPALQPRPRKETPCSP